MSELSELSGECDDCGEYLDDCICESPNEEVECLATRPQCWNREDFCECQEQKKRTISLEERLEFAAKHTE